ncbi:MAG: hypothetical protein PHH21_00060 [Candidatus Pacebacteria bacterium]|nr:hypothetical protein [Candidatus Paceibacterota bacterium]
MLNRDKITLASTFSLLGIFFAQAALAVCPVCVVGVGAGVGLARWLKIDDTITGLWIGGFTIALVLWTIEWLKKKNIKFAGMEILVAVIYYATVIWPLYSIEIIGHQYHKIWGMDKLILTIFIGSIAFFGFEKWYRAMRAKRGKSLFKYQKIVWAWLPLVILSVIFFFLTR